MGNETWLKSRFSFSPKIVAVHDLSWGTAVNHDGLEPKRVLETLARRKKLDVLSAEKKDAWNVDSVINESRADVILELTPTDLKTGEPAASHIRTALRAQKHVVTTNKGPVALFYRELRRIAQENGMQFRFEGTVMAGTPLFSLVEFGLAGQVRRIRGIVNGTTNFILTQMEEGKSYEEALKEAQRFGYAESDPTADVEGYDALAKILILANVVLDGELGPGDVPREGITHLAPEEVRKAPKEGFRWKLVVTAERGEDGKVWARVAPERVPLSDPLSQVRGVLNAITLELEPLGAITMIGPGAGGKVTGHAVLSDLLLIQRS